MKRLSITAKLTIWYALFMTIAVGIAWFSFMRAGNEVTNRYFRETLENTAILAADDLYMTENGLDFDFVPGDSDAARAALFDAQGDLIYGSALLDAPFAPGRHTVWHERNAEWRIYDMETHVEGFGSVIVRAYMNSAAAEEIIAGVSDAVSYILPAVIALAVLGGFAISRRALRPVKRITAAAESIADAGDLKKRIPVSGAKDELSTLSEVFNDMLSRLQAAFDRETRFTSDVSHEMRTPVAAILAESEAALTDGADEAEKTRALVSVKERAAALGRLISTLLMLSRMDAGRMKLVKEPVPAREALEAAAEEILEKYAFKRLNIEILADDFEIFCDQAMLYRLLLNLLDNACRHSPPEGRIQVSVERLQDEARISVLDLGEGIPEQALAHIFERFYRADTARSGEGTGLGLSICEGIARLHGGEIAAESREGEFTRFTVRLPMEQ